MVSGEEKVPAGGSGVILRERNRSTDVGFIGADLSLTSSGLAYYSNGRKEVLSIQPGDDRRDVKRLAYLHDGLCEFLDTFKGAVAVGVEDYAMGARGRTFSIGEWGGIARLEMHRRGMKIGLIPAARVQWFLLHSPKKNKPGMKKKAAEVYGLKLRNPDEADAITLAHMMYCRLHSAERLFTWQAAALSSITFIT